MICVDWHLGQLIAISEVIAGSGLSAYHYYSGLPNKQVKIEQELEKVDRRIKLTFIGHSM